MVYSLVAKWRELDSMKIIEKISNKNRDIYGADPATIAFLGDSVTQGCFECYKNGETVIETIHDPNSSYNVRFKEYLQFLFPSVPINIINAGISGDTIKNAKTRLDRDVLKFKPDLVVVSFGLNDSVANEGVDKFAMDLIETFNSIRKTGAEVLFMTENYMNTNVSPFIGDKFYRDYAVKNAKVQNSGQLAKYFDKAKSVCQAFEIPVCDMYDKWDKLSKNGVNVTELLSNKLNHPVREMHKYMAIRLLETIFEN